MNSSKSKYERVHEHMKFRDEKNDIVSDEVKEASKDFLNSLIAAVLGDSIAAGRVMIAIAKAPFLFENRFLEKILFISRWCLSFRGRKKRFACENNRKWNERRESFSFD